MPGDPVVQYLLVCVKKGEYPILETHETVQYEIHVCTYGSFFSVAVGRFEFHNVRLVFTPVERVGRDTYQKSLGERDFTNTHVVEVVHKRAAEILAGHLLFVKLLYTQTQIGHVVVPEVVP